MIRLDSVTKTYTRGGTSIEALRGVTLEIQEGEFCALVGPSGCGKSTLLNLMAGLDEPTAGDVVLRGQSTRLFGDAEWTRLRREILGMVFQAFHLIPGLSAAENVGLPLLLKGENGNVVRTRVAECLAVVDMTHRARHRPSELSGGEQQRVAIARAVVHRPQVLLADEPTGNLDSTHGAEIIELLQKLHREQGQTIILVTHSHAATSRTGRVVRLHDGRVVEEPVLA